MTTALRHVTRKTRRNLKRRWIGMPPPLGVPDTGRGWRRVRNFGFGHQCPICGSRLQRFITSPKPYVRPEALCPVCGSLEWHRFGWWYLTEKHGERIAAGANVLHVAAEPEIRRQLLAVPGLHYNALDLDLRRATVVGDLTALPLADGAIDLVYCSHVLEHVHDDRAAMTELRRIISPTGAALLQVPVTADRSWGDPTITDPKERERLFGQFDHVRVYGPDVVEILTACGWNVEHVTVDQCSPAEVKRLGLPRYEAAIAAGDIFWCTPR